MTNREGKNKPSSQYHYINRTANFWYETEHEFSIKLAFKIDQNGKQALQQLQEEPTLHHRSSSRSIITQIPLLLKSTIKPEDPS